MTDRAQDTHRPPWSSHRVMLRIVVLLSIISLIPIYAAAASASTSTAPCTTGTINIDDATHTVTGNSACAGAVTIPTGVTTINPEAFYQSDLTSVTIPTSVTIIGYGAFQQSTSLTSVTFVYPSHLTTIGEGAFSFTDLASITFPESVSSVGNLTFFRDLSLASVYFDGKAPTLGGPSAFFGIAPGAKIYRFTGATGFDCPYPFELLVVSTHPCIAGDSWPSEDAEGPFIADTPFPAQPPAPTAAAGGQWDQISVTATSSLIGPTPTSITITANPGGATCDVSGPSGSCMIKGLKENSSYTFTSIAHNADPTPSMESDASAPVATGSSPVAQIITQLLNNPDAETVSMLLQMLKNLDPQLYKMLTSVDAGPQQIGGSFGMNIQAINSNPASPSHQPEVAARAKKQVLCSVTKKIKRAGKVKLTCRYTKAALKLLRKHALKATLTITFTPVSGAATTKTKALTIKRLH